VRLGTWDVRRGTWDVGRETWDVGRGTWAGCWSLKASHFTKNFT
jgi:hypothetical protein